MMSAQVSTQHPVAATAPMSTMPPTPSPSIPDDYFAPMEAARWITVNNLPKQADEAWIRVVFARIGSPVCVQIDRTSTSLGIAHLCFNQPEQAIAALNLDGYVALGVTLRVHLGKHSAAALSPPVAPRKDMSFVHHGYNGLVVPTFPSKPRGSPLSPIGGRINVETQPPPAPQTHKNLYVLNLPLDATTDQLTALFSAHGTVVHCVILAMLDSQARRRGFIDMSDSSEAKSAIEAFNGFVWHGYPIEVSYAIVQRSGGPLSGPNAIRRNVPRSRWNCGPRRRPLDASTTPSPRSDSPSFSNHSYNGRRSPRDDMYSSCGSPGVAHDSAEGVCIDPYTIFITGLDPVAILDDEDLSNTLRSYGELAACSLSRDDNGISLGYGVATFTDTAGAAAAKEALDSKVQNGSRLSCKHLHFTRLPAAPTAQYYSPRYSPVPIGAIGSPNMSYAGSPGNMTPLPPLSPHYGMNTTLSPVWPYYQQPYTQLPSPMMPFHRSMSEGPSFPAHAHEDDMFAAQLSQQMSFSQPSESLGGIKVEGKEIKVEETSSPVKHATKDVRITPPEVPRISTDSLDVWNSTPTSPTSRAPSATLKTRASHFGPIGSSPPKKRDEIKHHQEFEAANASM